MCVCEGGFVCVCICGRNNTVGRSVHVFAKEM